MKVYQPNQNSRESKAVKVSINGEAQKSLHPTLYLKEINQNRGINRSLFLTACLTL